MTFNILITSISKKVLLVKSFKTYVNNNNGLLYTTDININSPALFFSDDYFISPRTDSDDYLNFMINKCKMYNIKLIIPTSCRELYFFAKNKEKFNEFGCNVMVCSTDSLDICQNKKKFVNFCIENSIPVPNTYNDKEDIKEYPVFSKPIYGAAGKSCIKINNNLELNNISFKDNIVQEFVDSQEYTIDYLGDFNGNYLKCIPRKRINVINGESCVSKICDSPIIVENCIKIGNLLKLVGHNTLQCFYDKNNNVIKFIEINPRFGGAGNLGITGGLNSPKIIIDLLINKEININQVDDSLVMLRYSSDIFGYIDNNIYKPMILKSNKKTFCIDIDGTICTENCKYEDAKPIKKTIDKINELYNNNKIILFTSRGYTSKFDWRPLTEKQLDSWGLKYHELIFGKPFADYYIDNKAIDILDWV